MESTSNPASSLPTDSADVSPVPAAGNGEANIDELLDRINGIAGGAGETVPEVPEDAEFIPRAPQNFRDANIAPAMVEEIVLKYLAGRGEASIRDTSEQVGLPFNMIEDLIVGLKQEQLLGYIGQAAMNDYICKLTEKGRERAIRYSNECSYFGSAPVHFKDYVASIHAQTINDQNPTEQDLKRAFSDLLIDPTTVSYTHLTLPTTPYV